MPCLPSCEPCRLCSKLLRLPIHHPFDHEMAFKLNTIRIGFQTQSGSWIFKSCLLGLKLACLLLRSVVKEELAALVGIASGCLGAWQVSRGNIMGPIHLCALNLDQSRDIYLMLGSLLYPCHQHLLGVSSLLNRCVAGVSQQASLISRCCAAVGYTSTDIIKGGERNIIVAERRQSMLRQSWRRRWLSMTVPKPAHGGLRKHLRWL